MLSWQEAPDLSLFPISRNHYAKSPRLSLFFFKYPKGLGNTVEEIDTNPFKDRVFSKTKFSMVIPEVEEQLKQLNVENIVLMGIEVCFKACLFFTYDGSHGDHVHRLSQ